MDRNPVVAGLGEILWDLLPDGKQLGGAPANFAYHAAKLGADAYPVSAVGADMLGKEILQRMDAVGISGAYIGTDPQHPTGTVSVLLDQGQPQYVIHTEVAWDYIPNTGALLEFARRTDAVCFGTLAQRAPVSRETIGAFLEYTRPDCLRVLDINLRQEFYSIEVIEASLRTANILKLNDAELPVVAELLGLTATGDRLLEQLAVRYDLHLIALTRGSRGSRLYTPEAVSDHPGLDVDLVDAVGAGDAFTAALATGFLRNHRLDVINDDANRLAAFVCTRKGAMPEYEYAAANRRILG